MAGIVAQNALENTLMLLVAAFGAFLVALWASLVIWTVRDIQSRSSERLLQILAPLVVLLLGPAGLIIYFILRPAETMAVVYQRTLESEALLSEIGDAPVCPGCGARTHTEWQICPHCHTRLKKPCVHCHRSMELPWKLCPFCGTLAQSMPFESVTDPSTPTT